MRIVTWNMGYWGHARAHDSAWRWLFNDLKPDIALLQECKPPAWVEGQARVLFDRAYPHSARQSWGTALVTIGLKTQPFCLQEVEDWLASLGEQASESCSAARLKGWCVAAEVDITDSDSRPVLVLSVHNPAFPIARSLLSGLDLTGMKLELNKDLWLLDVLFYFLKRRLDRPLLLGGDFNYSILLDDPVPRGNAEFFERIGREGFVSLHRLFKDADEQTFFHPKKRAHQLDYLFADATIGKRVTCCKVIQYESIRAFSDHAPLIAEIRHG